MKLTHVVVFAAVFAAAFFARAEEPKDDTKKLPATITPTVKDRNRHEGFVAIAKKGDVDLLFLGDSITDGWRGGGKKVWEENFAPLKAANFGIGGDRTQHVLWRIENGELDGIKPKLMVLMIGTNNGGDSKEDVALGITTIVKEYQKREPGSKVLLLGIFPRAPKDDKIQAASLENPGNLKNKQVNEIIAKLDDGGKTIKYMDIGAKFLDAEGKLPKEIMPDFLHPNAKGYEIWAEAILPTVKEMMK
ncbi:MAG TPA: GDSL-type esterase/lipase family protein [Planctomycetota bacterium]|nr:GDSL-type esterase/lipase family protein [Planctomycetota bacterium]